MRGRDGGQRERGGVRYGQELQAAVGIVHTDQITEFMIAGVEVTMLLTNGGYPVVKLLGVATADEVAAGSAGSRGGLGGRPRCRRCRRRRRRRYRGPASGH